MSEAPGAARRAVLDVLRAVRRGELADRALVTALAPLDARDRRFAQELSYGTLRLRGRLDHALAQHASRPLAQVDADVLDALRIGAYQLLELDGVPPYAAISESVELVKQQHPKAAGFANAVLQSVLRNAASLTYPRLEDNALAHLVTWGSHPRWLAERWLARYGEVDAAALAQHDNQRPRIFLRLLTADGAALLAAAGIETEPHPLARDVVALADDGDVQRALATAPAVVQDPAAALVVQYAAVPAGALVADLCAAPGGKAVAFATGGARCTVAADLSYRRLQRIRENGERAVRLGARAALALLVADGRAPAVRGADVALLDAPCTGTGTLRRHPDGRWRIGPADLVALVRLQRELLAASPAVVRPGGLLIYSTCSLEPEENEAQVEWFLMQHPEYRLEPAEGVPASVLAGGLLRVLPHRHGTDGAFAARMRRQG